MQRITRKSEVKILLSKCLKAYSSNGLKACVDMVHDDILSCKVKFPLLEYCAIELFKTLDSSQHIKFCDLIESYKTEGGNVILGKILQLRLGLDYNQSINKATEYIARADIWYVCDIIGERVYGHALLTHTENTIKRLTELSRHPSVWVQRSLGAGVHYAIKKGLAVRFVKRIFPLLLSMATTSDKEIRQGVGWATKTTAKFHPDLIKFYQKDIQDTERVANWFRKKVEIGLNRNLYAQRNRG